LLDDNMGYEGLSMIYNFVIDKSGTAIVIDLAHADATNDAQLKRSDPM